MGHITWHPSHWQYFDQIQNSMKFWNAFVYNILGQSQRNFAHVTTVWLSWHVQNFIEISWAYFKQEDSQFCLGFYPGTMPSLKTWELSWCQRCSQWQHCRLSWWQPAVLPVTTKLAPWWLSLFNDCVFCGCPILDVLQWIGRKIGHQYKSASNGHQTVSQADLIFYLWTFYDFWFALP